MKTEISSKAGRSDGSTPIANDAQASANPPIAKNNRGIKVKSQIKAGWTWNPSGITAGDDWETRL